jgi:hypothetical protein
MVRLYEKKGLDILKTDVHLALKSCVHMQPD